jgi:sugar-specific transcriptional regulator TrmB
MDTKILEDIGLSKNEIKAYFALVELGQVSASHLIKKSEISNSKIYPTLERLIKKGLVSYVIINNKKHFSASDPENLIDFLNNKEKNIEKQKQEIQKILPKIIEKRNLKEEIQQAEFYEGQKGVKAAICNILNVMNPDEEYYVFSLGEELKKPELKTFFREYHKKRASKKINAKLIGNKTIKSIMSQFHLFKYMQVRYTNLQLPTGVFIYKDTVLTIIWDTLPKAFVINSKTNYERYKEFFEDIWNKSN